MVGNAPNFTKIDILRCFLRINKKIGRKEIARELELGEGTVRTILENLKSKGFLASTKKGHFLSAKGSDALKTLYKFISSPKVGPFSLSHRLPEVGSKSIPKLFFIPYA